MPDCPDARDAWVLWLGANALDAWGWTWDARVLLPRASALMEWDGAQDSQVDLGTMRLGKWWVEPEFGLRNVEFPLGACAPREHMLWWC